MAEFVALSEMLKALQTAVAGRKSGAFFITSEDQHSAMITLDKGRITGVKYRSTRGYDAAGAIANFAHVRFQTAAEPTELPGEEGLDTTSVLHMLAGSPAAEEGDAVDDAESAVEVGAESLDRMRERYIAAIGPIGGALFDEEQDALGAEAGTRKGYARLVEALAAQIDDANEAASFRADVSLD